MKQNIPVDRLPPSLITTSYIRHFQRTAVSLNQRTRVEI